MNVAPRFIAVLQASVITAALLVASIPLPAYAAPSATILSPGHYETVDIDTFAPSVDWDGATNCFYNYNSTDDVSVNCELNGSDIPPPEEYGEHQLAVIGTDGEAGGGTGIVFIYVEELPDEEPIEITSCVELQLIGYDDYYPLDGNYVLNGPEGIIDCSASAGWNANEDEWEEGSVDGTLIPDSLDGVTNNGYFGFAPIGSPDYPFIGTFDGNGNVIEDLWIFRKTDQGESFRNEDVGLFSFLDEGATVSDVTLRNASIVGWNYVGGITGTLAHATLENVTVEDSMVRAYLGTDGGGLVGRMHYGEAPTIVSSHVVDGAVHGSGNVIGGLVGFMSVGSITNSTASADVDGGEYVGGAIGLMVGGSVSGTRVSGDAHADYSEDGLFLKSSGRVGGFVGAVEGEATIASSSATGAVSGFYEIGGFAGVIGSSATITNSYSAGDVTAVQETAGGFVGKNEGNISNAFARGSVAGTRGTLGGFVGANQGEISFAYTSSSVTGTGTGDEFWNVGGFVGDNIDGGRIISVYAAGLVSVTDAYGQVGQFAGYDGGIVSNSGYWNVPEIGQEWVIEGLEYVEDEQVAFKNPNHAILRLIACLSDEMTVTDLLKKCSLSQSALSQHLAILRNAGIVITRERGRNVYYKTSSTKYITLAQKILSVTK